MSSNNKDIANEFNKFYTSIAPTLDSKLPKSNIDPLSYMRGNYPDSMAVPHASPHDMIKIIKSLKDKQNDREIPTKLLKANSERIAEPLSILFNQSIITGTFPDQFKHACVLPLYKKDPQNEVENYRPISLLPVFSKIFESCMKGHLTTYLDSKSMITES